MTEKEKMLAGEIYDCGDTELITRWHLAKHLQQQYNAADSWGSVVTKSIPANCMAVGNPCRIIREFT